MDLSTIPGIITQHAPASPESVDRLRAELGLELPDEYVALLALTDGLDANSFTLYPSENVPERNRNYEEIPLVGRASVAGEVPVGGPSWGKGSRVTLRAGGTLRRPNGQSRVKAKPAPSKTPAAPRPTCSATCGLRGCRCGGTGRWIWYWGRAKAV
jgi:hypothetical protein